MVNPRNIAGNAEEEVCPFVDKKSHQGKNMCHVKEGKFLSSV